MGDLFGLVRSAIAKKLEEANLAVAEAQRLQAEAQQRAILRASGANVPEPSARPAPQPPSSPVPARSAAPSAGTRARQAASESAALDALFTARAATAAQRPGTSGLLAAFAGGEPLVAAFVLSEALAPPVALRPPRW